MKYLLYGIVGLLAFMVGLHVSRAPLFGTATTLSTATSDTLETFRTNVNTSLTNLASNDLSTTTANTFTATQTFPGLIAANASTSLLSANFAEFGGTATTTFLTNGRVGVASTSPWALFSVNPNALGVGVPEFSVGSTTATHFVVTGAGNVGIGTSTPGSLFSIQSIANFLTGTSTIYSGLKIAANIDVTGTATSTFSNGIVLTGGCVKVNGACIGSSGTGNTTTLYYATSTSDAVAAIPVVAGDIVQVYGGARNSNTTTCSNSDNTANFLLRPNTYAASTTLATLGNHAAGGGTQCGDMTAYQQTATTTDTWFFEVKTTAVYNLATVSAQKTH